MNSLQQMPGNGIIEFFNGNIIDVERGCIFPENTVLFTQKDRILKIGLPQETKPTADVRFDLKGATVMPAMINTHCHVTLVTPSIIFTLKDLQLVKKHARSQIEKGLSDCLDYGITVIRDALSDKLGTLRELRNQIEKGEIPGPKIFTSVLIAPLGGTYSQPVNRVQKLIGKLIGQPPPDFSNPDTGIVVVSPEADEKELKAAVETAIQRNPDFIKLCEQKEKMLTYKPGAKYFSLTQLKSVVDQCRKHGLDTIIHHTSVDAFRKSVAAGVSTLAHLPMDGQLNSEDMALFRDSNCHIEPTLSLAYFFCWKYPANPNNQTAYLESLTDLRRNNFSRIAEKYWLPVFRNSVIDNMNKADQGRFKAMNFLNVLNFYRYQADYISKAINNFQLMLAEADTNRISFGNDSGATHCSPAAKDAEIDLLRLIADQQKYDPEKFNADVLRMFTLNGAENLNISNDYGSLKEGKKADLVIYQKNPLNDISILKEKVDFLFQDGRLRIANRNNLSPTTDLN